MTTRAVRKKQLRSRSAERRFWMAMVAALAILVVWGFGGSFFLRGILPHQPSYIDSPDWPLYAAHGLAFAAWMALLFVQAGLVAAGNTALHRRMGTLALLVLPLLAASGLAVIRHGARHGPFVPGMSAPGLVTVAFLSLLFFLIAISLALHLRHRPAAHKRLMLIGTMMVAGAGTTRIPAVAALDLGNFDPTQLLLVPMLWWDWHSLGRIHPATLWGGLALVATNTAMGPLAEVAPWQALLAVLFA
jgi:hypothetical protein